MVHTCKRRGLAGNALRTFRGYQNDLETEGLVCKVRSGVLEHARYAAGAERLARSWRYALLH